MSINLIKIYLIDFINFIDFIDSFWRIFYHQQIRFEFLSGIFMLIIIKFFCLRFYNTNWEIRIKMHFYVWVLCGTNNN